MQTFSTPHVIGVQVCVEQVWSLLPDDLPAMRATRFALQLPVHYRPVGDAQWHVGQIENMSHTGVLFRAEDPLDADTPIELRVILPVAEGEGKPEVFCRARIVRTAPPAPGDARPYLAASLEAYEFIRALAEGLGKKSFE